MSRWLGAGWIVLVLGTAGCHRAEARVEKKPTAVKVKTAEVEQQGGDARYSGTIEPAAKVEVAFRAAGYIEEIGRLEDERGRARGAPIDVGDRVKKGQILARLRGADYAQRVASAKARSSEAEASAKLAAQDLDRAQRLYDSDAISKAELEARVAQHDAAIAGVAGATAQLGEASLALGDTVLRAPMDGVVLARHVEEGSLVAPGIVAFVIADVTAVKVVFGAPEPVVRRLKIGDALTVAPADALDEHAQAPLTVAVSRIAPAADRTGRLFAVESELPNKDGALRPGTVVSIRLHKPARDEERVVVPLGAVVRAPGEGRRFAVFVLPGSETNAAAELRVVALGDVVGNGVEITRGVVEGERVVVVGASLLRDGEPAAVIP